VIPNRSMPDAAVVPVLGYTDVAEAAGWLCAAFGFRERLRIADHRIQLVFGDGAVVDAQRQYFIGLRAEVEKRKNLPADRVRQSAAAAQALAKAMALPAEA